MLEERRRTIGRSAALLACLGLVVGCRVDTSGPGRGSVSAELGARTGQPLGVVDALGVQALPPHVVLDDGLTEDEAVAIAVWNNALLHETLTQLGVSRARLYDAGLLTDPQFTLFFPLGPKQFEMTVFQSVDAIWLRPIRVRAAKMDLHAVAQRMVQNGLDVIRDTRRAHAELLFAQQRSVLADEASALREEIRDLAESRLAAGDVSELEVMTIRVEALRAVADARRFAKDVEVAQHRLVWLLGSGPMPAPYAVPSGDPLPPFVEREQLVAEAEAMRPDLRAAEIDVEAACRRVELARNQFMTLEGGYDANSRGTKGFESGPALRFSLPIFNGNRGGRTIACAVYEQAAARTETLRDQIALEVRTAHAEVERAAENLRALREEILPALQEATDLARRNYENGAAPYFFVLETTSRFLEARARELELDAELRRAVADLERAVGRRLVPIPEPLAPIEIGPQLPLPAEGAAEDAAAEQSPAEASASPVEAASGESTLGNASSPVIRLGDAPPAEPSSDDERSPASRKKPGFYAAPGVLGDRVHYPLRRDLAAGVHGG